jgi:peptidoglycan/LPS O-acetylase OafA/YrhL
MIGLQFACVIVVAWAVTFTGRWLTWSPLLFVAKISYGLYLWHSLVFSAPQIDVLPQPIRSWVEWTLSFALAVASWYLLERPISRKFRGRFIRKGDPAPAQSPVLASLPGR